MLKSFNSDETKREVVKQIKILEASIQEETSEVPVSRDSQEDAQPTKTQKITLPISGKVVQAQGNSLKLACELVKAWGKQTKSSTDEMQEGSREE